MKVIRGKTPQARRVLLYGVHGVGKSTWAAQAPEVLFLDFEDGLSDIDCAKSEHLHELPELMAALRWLATEEHDFQTIAIDSADWLERAIHRDVAVGRNAESIADIPYGNGYKQALKQWDDVLNALEWLRANKRMMVILLAHSQVIRFDDPQGDGYDRYQPALHKYAAARLQEWCDEVFFASYRTFTKKEDQGFGKTRTVAVGDSERYIRTSETAAVQAKNRLSLPHEIDMNFQTYANHFAN